jgi:hypothetical protein
VVIPVQESDSVKKGDVMSLFEDGRFLYRDTLFVFFNQENRPGLSAVQSLFDGLGKKFELANVSNDGDKFESATLYSPQDYSAMDIVYIQGDEVSDQVEELKREFRTITLTSEDRKKLKMLEQSDCRFDVYHFGQVGNDCEEDDDFLDPGGLLLLLDRLATLVRGVSYDPQAQALL